MLWEIGGWGEGRWFWSFGPCEPSGECWETEFGRGRVPRFEHCPVSAVEPSLSLVSSPVQWLSKVMVRVKWYTFVTDLAWCPVGTHTWSCWVRKSPRGSRALLCGHLEGGWGKRTQAACLPGEPPLDLPTCRPSCIQTHLQGEAVGPVVLGNQKWLAEINRWEIVRLFQIYFWYQLIDVFIYAT